MESNNARALAAADSLAAAAVAYSRYARRLLDAEPGLAAVTCRSPMTREDMLSALAQADAGEETAMRRALRSLRKRVILQAAWAAGCSIFAYQPPSNADEKTKREVVELYRELARFVMEQAEGGAVRA